MRAACLALSGLLLTLPSTTSPALAQNKTAPSDRFHVVKSRIDHILSQMVADGRAAGVSALVWKDGREAYYGHSGLADVEAKRPMRRDTLVQIYSMTKPVTGVALMQLWEAGKFGLDDPLSRYLPEFSNMLVQDGADPDGQPLWRQAKRQITIRDILRHTAGFAYGGGESAAQKAYAAADPLARTHDLSEFGRRLSRVPLMYDPGERWFYSAAVDVQGLLVERLSGQRLDTYVRENILIPLKMHETDWEQPGERFERLAVTYYRSSSGRLVRSSDADLRAMNFPKPPLTMGGAGLVSSIDEYMRFARMLLNEGELDGVRILKPATVRLMATDHLDPRITDTSWLPSKGNVGFGFDFAVRTGQPKNAQEARGAVGEYFWDGAASTLFWVDPHNKLAAVFYVQTVPHQASLAFDIRRAVYGDDYLGPKGN